jgi:hypothetical protein
MRPLTTAIFALSISSPVVAAEVRPVYTVGESGTAGYTIRSAVVDLAAGSSWYCEFDFNAIKIPWVVTGARCTKLKPSGYNPSPGNYLAQGKIDPFPAQSLYADIPAYVMVDQNTHNVIACVLNGSSNGTCANTSLP